MPADPSEVFFCHAGLAPRSSGRSEESEEGVVAGDQTASAWRAARGRRASFVVAWEGGDKSFTTLSVAVERQGRGIDGAYRAVGLGDGDLDALLAAATPEGADMERVSLEVARDGIGRAVLMSRIAGREVPSWLLTDSRLGDLMARVASLSDVYTCGTCDAPLAPSRQIALTRARGRSDLVSACARCRGLPTTPPSGADHMEARAWALLMAGEPRRALVIAARAEAARCEPERLDPLRGAATLALSNPVQAAMYLRRAAARAPDDLWLRGQLVAALTQAGFIASATAELDDLVARRPALRPHAAAVRSATSSWVRRGGRADPAEQRELGGTLAAFAAAC